MYTECRPYRKALTTDATDTSFASKIATITEPSGNGVVDLTSFGSNGLVPARIIVLPYAVSGDNDTMDLRVIGWSRIGSGPKPAILWIPHPLGQFTVTLSAAVGIASAPIIATERFADTIIVHASIVVQHKSTDTDAAGAASTGDIKILSAANNLIAMIEIGVWGCEKLEFTFDTTAAGTSAMNALWRPL